MAYLNEIMDLELLESLISSRHISRKFHPTFPLALLKYSPVAAYDKKLIWRNELNFSRGLIYNTQTLEIVARPFAKFWNLNDESHPETLEINLPTDIPLITTKMDGSLGITYIWDNHNYIATAGSFDSEQATWAIEWLNKNHPDLVLPEGYTLLFEIIYKENKIVVSYDFEELVVIGAINKNTGAEMPRKCLELYCRLNKLTIVKDHKKSLTNCTHENFENFEGYVLTFSNGFKVKVKFENYCQIHRIIFGLNPHSIWELLKDGNYEQLISWQNNEQLPNDFREWVTNWYLELNKKYSDVFYSAINIYNSRPINVTRKELASYFLQNKKYASLLFSFLDNYKFLPIIWKMIEPKSTDTSGKEE